MFPCHRSTFTSFTFQARFALHQIAFKPSAVIRGDARCRLHSLDELVSDVRANCVSIGNKRLPVRRYDIGQRTTRGRMSVRLTSSSLIDVLPRCRVQTMKDGDDCKTLASSESRTACSLVRVPQNRGPFAFFL